MMGKDANKLAKVDGKKYAALNKLVKIAGFVATGAGKQGRTRHFSMKAVGIQ
jgi:hypothetical protein